MGVDAENKISFISFSFLLLKFLLYYIATCILGNSMPIFKKIAKQVSIRLYHLLG